MGCHNNSGYRSHGINWKPMKKTNVNSESMKDLFCSQYTENLKRYTFGTVPNTWDIWKAQTRYLLENVDHPSFTYWWRNWDKLVKHFEVLFPTEDLMYQIQVWFIMYTEKEHWNRDREEEPKEYCFKMHRPISFRSEKPTQNTQQPNTNCMVSTGSSPRNTRSWERKRCTRATEDTSA